MPALQVRRITFISPTLTFLALALRYIRQLRTAQVTREKKGGTRRTEDWNKRKQDQ